MALSFRLPSIYLGVLDDGTVEGVDRGQAAAIERNLVNVVSNPKLFNVAPAIETERIEYDGRLVIRVWVPAGPAVASFRHVIYDRLADELGSGMRNLYKYSKPYSGKDPVLDDGDVFEAFVPVRWIDAGHGEQVNEQVNEQVTGLSGREAALLDALRADPSITYARAAALLGVSYATARRAFLSLRERGLVRREGSDRKGVWRALG
ncbi:ATP-binding protein [Bifidobacterium vespertilionis]|uniref:ATP-binding protein n=1 Tax=Bifidobacterium vespertilionis TaxID=2562524 RepID=UPI001BDBB530|nr:ATP-binding protein [Bifidobacterium vespertilionis]MBT1179625.1 DeoR family transcriptional regulator [Bifidobacterium vespertilionis]